MYDFGLVFEIIAGNKFAINYCTLQTTLRALSPALQWYLWMYMRNFVTSWCRYMWECNAFPKLLVYQCNKIADKHSEICFQGLEHYIMKQQFHLWIYMDITVKQSWKFVDTFQIVAMYSTVCVRCGAESLNILFTTIDRHCKWPPRNSTTKHPIRNLFEFSMLHYV